MKKLLPIVATFMVATFLFTVNVQASTIYKGADVYEYDNIDNYQALKDSGMQVVIQKATQGLRVDSLLQYRSQTLQKYGFKIGYYCFANNTGNPEEQAQFFLDNVKNLHSDTVLWLDIEEGTWSKYGAIDFTNRFISYLNNKGYKVGVYTGLYFYEDKLKGNIPSIPLWLASYGRQPLEYPELVSWQWTGNGRIDGVIGDIDLDYFKDDIFVNNSAPSVSVPSYNPQTNIVNNTNNNINIYSQVQSILNSQGFRDKNGKSLNVDGIAGNLTLSACPTVKQGASGNLTQWIQLRVGATPDGKFGNMTTQAIKYMQRKWGLSPDGIVGKNTWRKLLGL